MTDKPQPGRWLLLIPQLPAKPAYLRVKTWRRLQAIGAISVKNAVYALPLNEQSREDFQWVLREIEAGGGEGIVCETVLVDGLKDSEVRALFDAARDADYAALAEAVRAVLPKRKGGRIDDAMAPQVRRLRQQMEKIAAIDFFGSTGRLTAEALLAEAEALVGGAKPVALAKTDTPKLNAKVWVTRRDVHVDRIACAWLIKRFVDPKARFKFVPGNNYARQAGEMRFDMFKGEFTHEGDKCSFEVLLERAGLHDPALTAIGEIVHDIDLKDDKFGREETRGIAQIIAGLCSQESDDAGRIVRGSAMFDGLHAQFRRMRVR